MLRQRPARYGVAAVRVPHLDGERGLQRVEQGKGCKERVVAKIFTDGCNLE